MHSSLSCSKKGKEKGWVNAIHSRLAHICHPVNTNKTDWLLYYFSVTQELIGWSWSLHPPHLPRLPFSKWAGELSYHIWFACACPVTSHQPVWRFVCFCLALYGKAAWRLCLTGMRRPVAFAGSVALGRGLSQFPYCQNLVHREGGELENILTDCKITIIL